MTPLEKLLHAVETKTEKPSRASGEGYVTACPAHDDSHESMYVREDERGGVIFKCYAGCESDSILNEIGLTGADLTHRGCTLKAYATAKKLSVSLLAGYGVSEFHMQGAPAIRIPYYSKDGRETAVRLRLALDGTHASRFRWKKGSKLSMYGLDRLDDALKVGFVVLCEGESDTHTLGSHGIPALGIPGATCWSESRDAPHLEGIDTIYVVIEPDKGDEAVLSWLSKSAIRDRVTLVSFGEYKDPSALHVADPDAFIERWNEIVSAGVTWNEYEDRHAYAVRQEAWEQCKHIAGATEILPLFTEAIRLSGLVGEDINAQILYLCVTSRLLDGRPVSAVIKGPSSGGKSYLVDRVLMLVPESSYVLLTGMSERALAYGDEDLRHRFIVISEAAGVAGEMQDYLLRTLLSEGFIRYEFVEKTSEGLQNRVVVREGPTGAIVSTTHEALHPENETRMYSLVVTDTPEQTRRILRAIATGPNSEFDPEPWVALQTWLEGGVHRVAIPYAVELSEMVPAVAVRLRRDFMAVLNLIKAHAILHQATRCRDVEGRIVATLQDYETVRALVVEPLSAGLESTVPETVRSTVNAVAHLEPVHPDGVPVAAIAKHLKLDKSAASRRVRSAKSRGFLINEENRRGRPARWQVDGSLPEDQPVLPTTAELAERCGVAWPTGGIGTPLPAATRGGRAA